MDIQTTATAHGALSAAIGLVLAWLTWRYGTLGRSPNKWIAGLRFSLWPVVPCAFFVGGGISRALLGLPALGINMTLSERLVGTLGVWVMGFLVFFPIGVVRARKKPAGSGSMSAPT